MDHPQQQYRDAAQALLNKGINFVGIDFDNTFVDIHTGGKWGKNCGQLAGFARPQFVDLIKVLLETNEICIAIVTFSKQKNLIQNVMNLVFGELAGRILIRTSESEAGCRVNDGKQKHLASAAEELKSSKKGLEITRNTTLLIDDDGTNIAIALDAQVRAIWFNPHEPESFLQQIINMP
eukprot:CAMPEP_0173174466 /NCGR_PEP_ID=MMETSP1141-20130122/3368_1 /TAXON_ID=483371 /ORGANISM="non described non described, Strain CCMP2298" /LENGTH=178 /DNA_ID=CAMNT_0014096593 /DNA_START=34 /DNA_END=570 /DNA_ORIENTATION=-